MNKIVNLVIIILISIFSWSVYSYYYSNKNLKAKEFTHKNINLIIKEKISKIPLLPNNTNNVIEFNNSLSTKIKNDKPRSFWNLLKSK